jgi:hypothetical protein
MSAKMATCASQVFDSGHSDASGKVCKRCNSKVLNAFTKCAKCDEYYHTSCIKILLDRGKKFCVIAESVMLCEKHCCEIHNIEEAFHKVLKNVNYQNSKLKGHPLVFGDRELQCIFSKGISPKRHKQIQCGFFANERQ